MCNFHKPFKNTYFNGRLNVSAKQAHSAEVQFTFAVGSATQMPTRTFCRLPVFSMNVVALLTVLG